MISFCKIVQLFVLSSLYASLIQFLSHRCGWMYSITHNKISMLMPEYEIDLSSVQSIVKNRGAHLCHDEMV